MKFSFLSFVMLIQSLAFAESKPEKMADLKKWDNQRPFDEIAGVDLWSVAEFKKQLITQIGLKEYKTLKNFGGPSSEVKIYKNYLFADICMQHNCAQERFDVIVQLDKSRVYVCRTSEAFAKKGLVHWTGSVKQKFDSKKSCATEINTGERDDKYFQERIDLIPRELTDLK